jgi:Holliday junction resolvase
MSESAITRRILAALQAAGVYAVKLHGGPYQEAGLPDILCCIDGKLVCFEVKTAAGKTTKVQDAMHTRLRRAGAAVAVVRSLPDVFDFLDYLAR